MSGFTDQCATQIKSLQKKMEGFVTHFQQAEQAKLTELKALAKTGDIPDATLVEAQASASAVEAMAQELDGAHAGALEAAKIWGDSSRAAVRCCDRPLPTMIPAFTPGMCPSVQRSPPRAPPRSTHSQKIFCARP